MAHRGIVAVVVVSPRVLVPSLATPRNRLGSVESLEAGKAAGAVRVEVAVALAGRALVCCRTATPRHK